MSAQADQDMERLDAALKVLEEHFDTVQIFTTRYDGGEGHGTVYGIRACGNFYARYGQVRHWLLLEDEATRLKAKLDD